MLLADLISINEARRRRETVGTVTDLASGGQRVIHGADVASSVGNAFKNVYLPPPRIVIIGAVHIAQALGRMAELADFEVRVIDPRSAFATPDRFQGIDVSSEWPEDALYTFPLDQFTAIVALSHDPRIDDFPIMSGLHHNCFYVGALGSRTTHSRRLERFAASGVSDSLLSRIKGPIGIDIHARNPAEIAVAILAEIIREWRTHRDLPP